MKNISPFRRKSKEFSRTLLGRDSDSKPYLISFDRFQTFDTFINLLSFV